MSEKNKPEHSLLNEYAQKYGINKKLPEYQFDETVNINKNKVFRAKCSYEGNVTEGTASSKNEAKRISAGHMLNLLENKNGSKFLKTPVQIEEVHLERKLEDFNKDKLEVYLDKYFANRVKDFSKFRKLFLHLQESTENQTHLADDIKPPKSKTLDKLMISGINVVNLENACKLFNAIIQDMNLSCFAEFVETVNNDRYAVFIKLNINLFTAGGMGKTPDEAIQVSCKNAIEFLYLFSL